MSVLKKIINSCLLAGIGFLFSFQNNTFKSLQLKNTRVKAAYDRHWTELQRLLEGKKINKTTFELYLRAFKQEGVLEVWAKSKGEKSYVLLKSFPICAKSGALGPKRKQGDGQVPEGFYEIASFQPQSSYHLALKVGYPNKSDRLKAFSNDPGGDIMIHGNCVTIGCIPIQNESIEELYILCVEARNRGFTIYTDIYPCKFEERNELLLKTANKETQLFWTSLKAAYDYFELNKTLAKVKTSPQGNYIIN